MNQTSGPADGFPRSIDLAGETILLRQLGADDGTRLLDFFLSLPPADLLFLQRDVTDAREIEAWMQEVAAGNTMTLLAEAEGTLLGEATLRSSLVPWTKHVGTIRVITAAIQRGRGLGRLLIEELREHAARRGIEKLVAEMTVEQVAAKRLFEGLGFREEGRYRGYVKDRRGATHDLIVMTSDQPSLISPVAMAAPAVHPWRCNACGHVTAAGDAPARCPDCGADGELLTVIGEQAAEPLHAQAPRNGPTV